MKNTKKLLLIVGALILAVAVFIYCPKKLCFSKRNIEKIVYTDRYGTIDTKGYYANIDPQYYDELLTNINHSWVFTRIDEQRSPVRYRIAIYYKNGSEKMIYDMAEVSGIPFYIYKNTFDFSVCLKMIDNDSIVYNH